ncbi:GMC family oxidoreductase N-terminal domain-containing protein [Comamonas testosteroni]|uniref:Glucose-methanol-choline oxidoreductase n=1 Tax=Comamonas testosteroni (strain DSM 14576 / KF-1) TaxID=399795 RepID=B7X4X6_COMTK|nr:GMC family oxidoreductase N-terminal domain-containing protein [Comamonas testosteroni]EED68754.1 glucose-methanol-choline oxidoreductase [Comamonas testosteroni KF-1]WQG66755.1 GMC family oxidoreductase N-terminal domain-containing protein [Comamonas testosteroni]
MEEIFDYIVIGAGSAGGTLAARLSENREHKVLLLEGGASHKDLLVSMPSGWGQMINSPQYSWGHETEPEHYAAHRRISLPRGKRLGGSSSINGMIYVRGDRADFDSWAAQGAAGWSYEQLLPYFVRTEDQQRSEAEFIQPWHGRGGPLTANNLHHPHPVSLAMVRAAIQAGLPACRDFNNGHPQGAGLFQVNLKNGRRSSVASNAIEPAMQRRNLDVRMQLLVTGIGLDGLRASTVHWKDRAGASHAARAGKEVLLCAGALQSPQLLMLSGIGPAAHLQEMGIEVKVDLPGVGANLQDHAIVPMSWRMKAGTPSLNRSLRGLGIGASLLRYLLTRQGAMAMPASEFAAWFSSDASLPYNDIQIHGLPVTGDIEGYMQSGKNYRTEAFPGMTMAPYQVRPYSRGQLQLKSRHPEELASIRMNFLHDERDRKALLHGVRMASTIARQPALAGLIETQTRPTPDLQSDDELLDWISMYLGSGHHASGSCRMGDAADPLSVVTSDLRVKGVQGLRVIDASVMPHLVSGNTNAASVVIGDKGADLVLGLTPPANRMSDMSGAAAAALSDGARAAAVA